MLGDLGHLVIHPLHRADEQDLVPDQMFCSSSCCLLLPFTLLALGELDQVFLVLAGTGRAARPDVWPLDAALGWDRAIAGGAFGGVRQGGGATPCSAA